MSSPSATAGDAAPPTLGDALALGLTRAEYELVCEKQGGPPNAVELAMYSLLWSEHCAYKHSKRLLRSLPTEGEHVVIGPGENAGAVDVGGGHALVLLGASTGRDGIGGASVLASSELDGAPGSGAGAGAGQGEDMRPTVQVGDPFEEKKLLECSLELLERGLLVSLQDLGAAGLTSSACEMASKGGVGIDLDVARVPLREPGMEPFEGMVSEARERMLCLVDGA